MTNGNDWQKEIDEWMDETRGAMWFGIIVYGSSLLVVFALGFVLGWIIG